MALPTREDTTKAMIDFKGAALPLALVFLGLLKTPALAQGPAPTIDIQTLGTSLAAKAGISKPKNVDNPKLGRKRFGQSSGFGTPNPTIEINLKGLIAKAHLTTSQGAMIAAYGVIGHEMLHHAGLGQTAKKVSEHSDPPTFKECEHGQIVLWQRKYYCDAWDDWYPDAYNADPAGVGPILYDICNLALLKQKELEGLQGLIDACSGTGADTVGPGGTPGGPYELPNVGDFQGDVGHCEPCDQLHGF
jgi:hypothetical protein